MLKTAARLVFLRVLPRRILPIVTVVEALLFLRQLRNRSGVRRNAPTESPTAPPRPTAPAEEPPTRPVDGLPTA